MCHLKAVAVNFNVRQCKMVIEYNKMYNAEFFTVRMICEESKIYELPFDAHTTRY